jgi:hypothetical protein
MIKKKKVMVLIMPVLMKHGNLKNMIKIIMGVC